MAERNKRAKRSQYVEYGGKTDKYTWDQFEDEVVINVTFPPGTRGKDIDCVFHKKYLKLQKKGEPAIFDGETEYEIDVDDSTWTISDGKVEIILVKGVNSAVWWSCVQVGHPAISVKDIEGAKYLDDSILKKIYEQKKRQAEEAKNAPEGTEEKTETN
eukprot:TRINITY_DN3416_c0_g1_i1.p1 TRINITY_DN3416_c0_g1~~TRINITY_DN3416_c0_g1_i1.p1  ORF type:complete len:158 (-),score=52.38 TRINITY_DN3416_c0_g1_i1:6-479(-)